LGPTDVQNIIYTTPLPHFSLDDASIPTYVPTATNTVLTNINHDLGHLFLDPASSIGTLGKFVCGSKDAGIWVVSGSYGFQSNSQDTQVNIAFAVNGGTPTPYMAVQNVHGHTWNYFITRFLRMNAGDYLQVSTYQNSGVTIQGNQQLFGGVRISA
jgi:hypothetical protein